MNGYGFVSFLTDFGLEDGFVAACHGVAARIAPAARLIDITHLVPRGDIRRGAAVLAQTVPYLPPAVHVAVVDPGVGTARRAIAVAAGDAIMVGPDNGLLSWAISALGGSGRAVWLTNDRYWLRPVSATFHGRDIFMPVGAHLAAGTALPAVGEEVDPDTLVVLEPPFRALRDNTADGEVVSIDRFGNAQLSLFAADTAALGIRTGSRLILRWGSRTLTIPVAATFGAVAPGEVIALTDSAGMLSLAVNGGSAAERFGFTPGTRVTVGPAA